MHRQDESERKVTRNRGKRKGTTTREGKERQTVHARSWYVLPKKNSQIILDNFDDEKGRYRNKLIPDNLFLDFR